MGNTEFNSALHSIIASCKVGDYDKANQQVQSKLYGKLSDKQHSGIESLLDLICMASKIQKSKKLDDFEKKELIEDNIEYYEVDFEALDPILEPATR